MQIPPLLALLWACNASSAGIATRTSIGRVELGPPAMEGHELVARAPGVVERWQKVAGGVEQSWTVSQQLAPANGTLALDVAVSGGTLVRAAQGFQVATHAGTIAVGHFAAWDAAERRLALSVRPTSAGYRIEVSVADAHWPVVVDPVYATASQAILGDSSLGLAFNLQPAGDVNGDGYDDVAAAAIFENLRSAAVFDGGPGFPASAPASITTAFDPSIFASWAPSLASGDTNGDGYSDLLIGSNPDQAIFSTAELMTGSAGGVTGPAVTWDDTPGFAGGVAVADVNADGFDDLAMYGGGGFPVTGPGIYFGGPTGPTAAADATVPVVDSDFGERMASVGDVDADGYADVAMGMEIYVGAPIFGMVREATIAYGSATGAMTTGAKLGSADLLAGPGDVDGDGFDDLLASSDDGTTASVYLGGAAGLSGGASFIASAPEIWTTLAGGDLDGDGYGDIGLADYLLNSQAGEVVLYHGSSAGIAPATAEVLVGEPITNFGSGLALPGDLDGDGVPELLVEAGYGSTANLRVFDAGTISATTPRATVDNGSDSHLGLAVVDGGDITGDGRRDVVVLSVDHATGLDAVSVYAGDGVGLPPTATSTALLVDGDSIAAAGDIDGDGRDDVLVATSGGVDVFLGRTDGIGATPDAVLVPPGLVEVSSVAGAGDVNGDGFDDVVVGDWESTGGTAWICYGSAAGVSAAGATALVGTAAANLGDVVAGAGDVDGDGYDDVATGYKGQSPAGFLEVFRGGATGISTLASWTVSGASGSGFGTAVAEADLDGDGYDDLVVTAPGAATYGSFDVYYGGPAGISSFAKSTSTGNASVHIGDTLAIGDTDGDGFPDVASSRAFLAYEGTALFVGSPVGPASAPSSTVYEDDPVAGFTQVTGLALVDVDGDGLADLIAGAPDTYGDRGQLAVHLGYGDDDGDGYQADVDCDDADPAINPGAVETWYDGIDSDCGGDDDFDQDTDGYEFPADCNDVDPTVFPGAAETWYDGQDSDCAANDDFDQDDDGSDSPADCNDLDPLVYPGAPDAWYDGVDSDCAGNADFDQDGDGRPVSGDCDDADPGVYPGAAETWYDGVDSDCAGDDDFDADKDSADFPADCDDGDPAVFPGAVDAPYDGVDSDCAGNDDFDADGDTSDWPADCDDTVPSIHPGAQDAWYDGIDSDCAGNDDFDADSDGVPVPDDCDDSDPDVHPGATEIDGNGIDDDCDGFVDGAGTTSGGGTGTNDPGNGSPGGGTSAGDAAGGSGGCDTVARPERWLISFGLMALCRRRSRPRDRRDAQGGEDG